MRSTTEGNHDINLFVGCDVIIAMETAALRDCFSPRDREKVAAFKQVASGEASWDAATECMYCLRESGEKNPCTPTT